MSIFISGPINVILIRYQNIKFILFSDLHFSKKGSCPPTIINSKGVQHYNVVDAIQKIIEDHRDLYIDIYIESIFPSGTNINRSLEDNYHGYLPDTIIRYHDCLYRKNECRYPNARFHYIDIRFTLDVDDSLSEDFLGMVRLFINHYCGEDSKERFIADNKRLAYHLNFFLYTSIIGWFLNTDRYIDSNLFVYHNLCIVLPCLLVINDGFIHQE